MARRISGQCVVVVVAVGAAAAQSRRNRSVCPRSLRNLIFVVVRLMRSRQR